MVLPRRGSTIDQPGHSSAKTHHSCKNESSTRKRVLYRSPFYYSDGLLSLEEFRIICRALFRNEKGNVYELEESKLKQIFDVFDKNKDGFIDLEEFTFCWNHWIKIVNNPHT